MVLPDIDFERIREHQGSRHKAFEELCCQLASLECRDEEEYYRKGPGADAGVECFIRFPSGQETGWQVKYYWEIDSLLLSLDDSIKQALAKHPEINSYIVCIPFDFSDARTGKGMTPLQKWRNWRSRWQDKAKESGRKLSIELWSASVIREKLTRDSPEYAGRTLYWFNEKILTFSWFWQKFDAAKIDLWSRYTAETNINLPIRQAILGFARDPVLHHRIKESAREIIRESRHTVLAVGRLAPVLSDVSKELEESLSSLQLLLPINPIGPADQFPVDEWRKTLASILQTLGRIIEWCFESVSPPSKEVQEQQNQLRSYIWQLQKKLEKFRGDLEEDLWAYVNARRLLIHGDGGIGKSHLLADVAAHQIDRGRPAVLLLGQKFFMSDPWDQIIRELGLPAGTSAEQFLASLDAAAQAEGVRALILIDALNERHGKDLWPDRLASFLRKMDGFPHLCIVLSCRTTYLPYIIPDSLTEHELPRLHHHGFGNNDARAYLMVRGIVLPGSPVPAPEFSNPLFLKSCCDALINDGRREFPRGISGATAVFTFYRDAVARQIDRRLELDHRRQIVKRAVDSLAQAMAVDKTEYLSVARVQVLFDAILPSGSRRDSDLLTQLESEGMLTVEVTDDGDGYIEDAVRFTFQRFSDHAIAAHLIERHVDKSNPVAAFAPGAPLNPYISSSLAWEMAGVLEALAVQLPERFQLELPELASEHEHYAVSNAFKASLLWRVPESFTQRTLDLVDKVLGRDQVLDTILHIATEPKNAFNAQYLHTKLLSWQMPERDARWSIPVAVMGMDENSPIWTLIDWAWDNGFDVVEDQRAKLAGMTLCWFMTTTNRAVRDRATKAQTALLAKRPVLAAELLGLFWDIDDDYLRERLVAAIYGAILQGMMDDRAVGALVQAVYAKIFADEGALPVNALIRDHARFIVEYALWRKCLTTDVDLVKVRPPYKSQKPLEFVPDEIIDGFKQTYKDGALHRTAIVGSTVNDGDFARYVIDSYVRYWSPAEINCTKLPTDRDVYQSWLSAFKASASDEAQSAFQELIQKARLLKGQGRWEKSPERVEFDEAENAFRATLSMEAFEDYRVRFQSWVAHGLYEFRHSGPAQFDRNWARRWVCKRAHDLGWSMELHGAFDSGRNITHDRTNHGIERIGKKYQWLALYELGARLADNYAFIGEERQGNKPGKYEGESFGSLRDLDPSLLIRETHDDGWERFMEPTWWAPILPQLGPSTAADRLQWLYSDGDMIDDVRCIDVADRLSRRWLVLNNFVSAREWSIDGDGLGRDSWSRINCVVVKKKSLKSLLRQLEGVHLGDPHSLPLIEFYAGDSYLGEYPWHPTFVGLRDWVKARDSNRGLPVASRPTVTEYTCSKGGYDYSLDESIRVEMPAPWLLAAMRLRMSNGRFPAFVDNKEEVKFIDPALTAIGPHASLIDREAFLTVLETEGLAPLWVVAGEKGVYGGHDRGFGGRLNFTSFYWLQDGKWMHRRHKEFELPSQEQVAELLGRVPPNWVKTSEL